jgi:hypothetical protein
MARSRPWAFGNTRARGPGTPGNRPFSRHQAGYALALGLALLASCGGGDSPVPPATPFADPGFVEAGEWRLAYALTPSRDLPVGIAGTYGIERRRDLAVLVVALAPRDARADARLADAEAEATAVALTGERTRLALSRRDEAGGATWLATAAIRHRVPVTIEIRARATPEAPPLRARLTREFRVD